jgi:hypothetical protein
MERSAIRDRSINSNTFPGFASDRHCEERSDEAIQLLNFRKESWIASRSLSSGAHSRDPLARNDGRIHLRILAARCVRVLPRSSPSEIRGRRECRARDAPAALRAKKAHKRSHHGHTGITRHSPRNGFTVSFVLSPVSRALLPPSSAVCLRQLDTGVRVSGPHDFAVRVSAVRLWHFPRPPHPVPRP